MKKIYHYQFNTTHVIVFNCNNFYSLATQKPNEVLSLLHFFFQVKSNDEEFLNLTKDKFNFDYKNNFDQNLRIIFFFLKK